MQLSARGVCGWLALGAWALALVLALAVVLVRGARADEASGTWSGTLEGRTNYYWERSTRVVVPEGRLDLEAPNGIRMHGEYLVDVISSASIGQGVEEDGVITELRHGVGAGVGKELDFGSSQLDLSIHGTYSTENDYKSWIYGLETSLSFAERNSKISLGVTRVSDDIEANNDPAWSGELDGVTVSLGLEQILGPRITFSFGYQLAYLEGFLGNAYRRVTFEQGAPSRESPPDTRLRHNLTSRVAFALPSGTAVHVLNRGYLDSWEIAAITPELRVYQELGQSSFVRLRYRFYAQSSAEFARETAYPGSPLDYTDPTTNDPKLLAMRTHTLGFAFEQRLDFLAGTFLDFAQQTWLDIGLDRYWSTSAFGNGVIGTVGGRMPF
jgi:hypothetical protein